jgi:hypothetical protein
MDTAENILNYFYILKTKHTLGGSYLFVGDNQFLLEKIIKLVACKMSNYFCNQCWDCIAIEKQTHPDLFVVLPEPNVIKIEKIRESRQFLSLKSFRLLYKILIIKGDEWSQEAANSFLKILEEPPRNSFIGIYTSKIENIFPTIRSRCKKIFLPCQQMREEFSYELAYSFLRGKDITFRTRKEFSSFLKTLIVIMRDYLFYKMKLDNRLLPKYKDYEIIMKPHSLEDIIDILDILLKIHNVYHNMNEKLALNLIRTKLY